MAELEITYIPYGLDEISQLDLMTNLANGLPDFVKSYKWLLKPGITEKFLNAYKDIINHGITGASNSSGLWEITHNGDKIDTSTMSPIDKQIYEHAAYYIQLKMALMTPRKKEEETAKKDLKDFNFINDFNTSILNEYGGLQALFSDPETGWNSLDPRGDNGLRGIDKRRDKVKTILQNYLRNYKDGLYNFEGTPFKDDADVKAKVLKAIDALDTIDNTTDDVEAFNALGLPYRTYFSNGGNEATTHINQKTGNPYTYNEWNLYQLQLAEAKAKLEAEKAKAQQANYWKGFKSPDFSKLNGRPLKTEESNIDYLTLLFSKGNWNGDEASQIVSAFKLADKNGQLVPLSKEELAKLNPTIWGNRAKYLRKINGINSPLYYDTLNKLFKYFYNLNSPQTSFLDILNLNSPEVLKEKQNKQATVNMNTPISLMTEWSPEMKKEIEAIAWDAASILNPEAFTGSAMALNAARLRGEANPNRSILESTLDYGTGLLGGILGFGDLLVTGKLGYRLYQLGKSIGSVSKFAGIMGAGFGAIGAYEARDSIAKLTNPDSLTPQDLENISYGLMGLIGLKSFAKARNKQTIGKQANPTITEHNITIKDKNGKTHEVKVDEVTAGEINSSYGYGKKKADVDSKTFNHAKVKEAVLKYNEGKNPTEKLELEGASIQSSSILGRVTGKDAVKPKQVKNPNTPEYVPVGTKRYNPFGYMALGNNKWGYYLGGGWQRKAWENAAPEHSSKGLWLRAKEFWSPEPKPIKTPESTVETPKTETTSNPSKTSSINTKSYNKNQNYEYNILNTPNKSSSRILLKGDSLTATLADGNNYRFVYSNEGEAIVMLNGKPVVNPVKVKNLKEAKEIFSNFVKDINSKLQKSNQGKFVRRFESKYLDHIRELKRKGFFMKQGGQINPSLDEIIKDFINNNNI